MRSSGQHCYGRPWSMVHGARQQGARPLAMHGAWVHWGPGGALGKPQGRWLSCSWGSKDGQELKRTLGTAAPGAGAQPGQEGTGPRPGAEGRAEKGGSGPGPFQAWGGWAPTLELREKLGRLAPGWVGALARGCSPKAPWSLWPSEAGVPQAPLETKA